MINNIVGRNIRRLREKLGITQEELALRCDLTQGYINFLENGRRGYTKSSLSKIANALGVRVSQLFEERKEKIPLRIAESSPKYSKRWHVYEDIISLLDKLPDAIVDHYRMLLSVEISIREKQGR